MIRKKIFTLFLISFVAFCLANMANAEGKDYKRSIENYTVPDVMLINQDGAKISLQSYLNTDQPVFLDFFFSTCTTICPVLSAGFAGLQNHLGSDVAKARLVSITIDPEHDTPRVLKAYRKKFHAREGWDFLTGTKADIDLVMKSFDAYVYDKMDHEQLTFVRSPKDGKWVRIEQLVGGGVLMNEFNQVTKN